MQAHHAIWPTLSALSAQPVITYINGDERVELSGPSLSNAAAKIANALVLEFDLAEGDSVELRLPWHWQRAVWQAGCLTAGVAWTIHDTDTPHGSVHIAGEELAISLHPFGLPVNVSNDITPLIQAQPDALIISPALANEALEAATQYAQAHEVREGDRVLVCDTDARDDRYLPLLVPLVTRGSLVMATGPWEHTMSAEGITRRWSAATAP